MTVQAIGPPGSYGNDKGAPAGAPRHPCGSGSATPALTPRPARSCRQLSYPTVVEHRPSTAGA